ncbi:alcohol dehydrogenase catalytic domain-containing protein [Planctomycetota bacterium]
MKQLVITSPGSISVKDISPNDPSPDEVAVKVDSCGICGTDLHIVKGEYLGDYPVIPGHELSGTISSIGTEVTGFKEGDRVAVEPNISCGTCGQCLKGKTNFCANWTAVGVTRPGGFAEYVNVPAKNVFSIGALPFEQAVFMEPLSCVIHGIEKLNTGKGTAAFVAGAGPVGNLIIQVLAAKGAEVHAGEISSHRREQAALNGACRVFDTSKSFNQIIEEFPDKYDIAVDATGIPSVMENLVSLVKPGGEILLFGVPPGDSKITLNPFYLFKNGITIFTSYTSADNSEQAIHLLSSGSVITDTLISHTVALGEFESGITYVEDPDTYNTMKVLVSPGEIK